MAEKLIFLSHIHEESELAVLIKDALEQEFSGFVEVFVSSDGTSIPAGSNFLRRIEDGLVNCIGAIYLISPKSVKRNWINFELGAVWIRNAINIRSSGPEIPTVPFCHSGTTPATLPAPLNNLNAINANNSSELERAFRALHHAAGGRGSLRTNFDILAEKIRTIESKFTIGLNLKSFILLTGRDINETIEICRTQPGIEKLRIELGFVESSTIKELLEFESGSLKGHVQTIVGDSIIRAGRVGTEQGAQTAVCLNMITVRQNLDALLD